MSDKVFPGSFLGYIYEYTKGESGVYQKDDKLYSSLCRTKKISNETIPPTINVLNERSEYLPVVGDVVYAKITKVQKNQAICEIFANNSKIIRSAEGIIKHEDVKDDYKDFDMFDCFVPGDIVVAKIKSVDSSNYVYLTSAEVDKGVVFSRSTLSGDLMMPVSCEMMECLETHMREKRKVAKPNYI